MAYQDRTNAALNVALRRQYGTPLDVSSIFSSIADLEAYVKQNAAYAPYEDAKENSFLQGINPYSYAGQIVAVVDATAGTAKAYVIDKVGKDGSYSEVGSSVKVDEKSIDLLNGVISIHGIGTAGQGYSLVSDGNGGITWSKPSETTVEGLSALIDALDKRVDDAEAAITRIDGEIDALDEAIAQKAEASALNDYLLKSDASIAYATKEELKNKADTSVTNGLNTRLEAVEGAYVKSVVYTEGGKFTITDQAGNVTNVDLDIEKVVTNFDYNEEEETLELTLADGTVKEVSLSAFIDVYTAAKDAQEVQVNIVDKVISATLVDGAVSTAKIADDAVTSDKLADTIVTDIAKGVAANEAVASKAEQSVVEGIASRVGVNEEAIITINNNLKDKVDATQVNTLISEATIAAGKIDGVVAEATKAQSADKVANSLKVTVNGVETTFDGSEQKEIVINTQQISSDLEALQSRVKTNEDNISTLTTTVTNLSTSVVKEVKVAGEALSLENGSVNITSISTDMLVQGTKTLILDGGNA